MRVDEETITRLLNEYQAGASLEEISQKLPTSVPKRTLQRSLAKLVTSGYLARKGQGRATRYLLKQPIVSDYSPAEAGIPLSPEAKKVKQYVNQTLGQRKPVGYQREFLESYQPNKSYYLPDDLRERLTKVGKQPDGDQPAGTFARMILTRLLIDLSWNSSRLEGNTYSLLETQRLLEFGENSAGKSARDAQMILNHKAAIEFLLDTKSVISLNNYTIFNLHSLLADNLLSNPNAIGRLRKIPVGIGRTVYYPLEIPQLIADYFEKIIKIASEIHDPLEQAFFLMVHIPYLQAFEDVNKRVSRLAANIPLIKNNYCPLSFVELPKSAYTEAILGVYELNDVTLLRDVFAWSYERSASRYSGIKDSMGEPDAFRLRYRSQIMVLVRCIVIEKIGPKQVINFIEKWSAENIAKPDQTYFKNIIETEIMNLYSGNLARYQLTEYEFQDWQAQWRDE